MRCGWTRPVYLGTETFPSASITHHIALQGGRQFICVFLLLYFSPWDSSYRATIRVNKSCIRATVPASFLIVSFLLPVRI